MTRLPAFIYRAAFTGLVQYGLVYIFVVQASFFRGGLALTFGMMVLVMMVL